MARRRQKSLFPELDKIISDLKSDAQQDLVILFIPSHDKEETLLQDQEMWANAALDLFGEVYGGATALQAFAGVYKAEDGRLLHDRPILVQSYTMRANLEDRTKLMQLLRFMKRMGREADQEAVGLVVNQVFHAITDFSDR